MHLSTGNLAVQWRRQGLWAQAQDTVFIAVLLVIRQRFCLSYYKHRNIL